MEKLKEDTSSTEKNFFNETISLCNQRFTLTELAPKECFEKRKDLISGFLLKSNGHIYFTELPKTNISMNNLGLGDHLCFNCKRSCALSDKQGGCAKIRDLFPTGTLKNHNRWTPYNCMIEKYNFIISGYERFNCSNEILVVSECLNFEESPPDKKYSQTEITRMKLGLAQYLVPDAKSVLEAQRLLSRDNYKSFLRNFY